MDWYRARSSSGQRSAWLSQGRAHSRSTSGRRSFSASTASAKYRSAPRAIPEIKCRTPAAYSSSRAAAIRPFRATQRGSSSRVPQGSLLGRCPVKQQVSFSPTPEPSSPIKYRHCSPKRRRSQQKSKVCSIPVPVLKIGGCIFPENAYNETWTTERTVFRAG